MCTRWSLASLAVLLASGCTFDSTGAGGESSSESESITTAVDGNAARAPKLHVEWESP